MGSNPIARSFYSSYFLASWPSGKARVCKTLITGSNPVDASRTTVKIRMHGYASEFFYPVGERDGLNSQGERAKGPPLPDRMG